VLRLQARIDPHPHRLDAATLAIPRAQSAIGRSQGKNAGQRINSSAARQPRELSGGQEMSCESCRGGARGLEDKMAARTLVRSPVKWRGERPIANKTPGGVVQPGTPMAEIVAVEDSLLVEARIGRRTSPSSRSGRSDALSSRPRLQHLMAGWKASSCMSAADSIQPQSQPGQSPSRTMSAHVAAL